MSYQHKKILIISPHCDDEVLGCGGLLAKEGRNSFVYYCGVDKFHVVSMEERLKEVQSVADFLGFEWDYNRLALVNNYDEHYFIGIIENLINTIKPGMLFVTVVPSYNQDHRAIFEATFTAVRPHDKNFFVKKVLMYEQADSFIWNKEAINPNYFVPIDIDKKIEAYKLHRSQARGHRGPELLTAMAKARGAQINVPYAEAFQIMRWVD